ncbi:MAG: DUF58 domain-containing protein [Lentisphaeria bacterium]|nr:DUF58 domain-containing protein [Lentisphaeria bacterium]
MNFDYDAYIQRKLSRFLDGPETFQFNALRNGTHRKYRSSTLALFAWIVGLARLFLSPIGFYLAPVAVMLVAYASVAMDAPMRVMVLIFLAVFLVELILGFWYRPRIDIIRLMPDRVRAKSQFKVHFVLHNRRRFPAWDIWADPFNYAPGLVIEQHAAMAELPAKADVKLESRVFAKRRGRYLVYTARVESRFPFNLVKWSCRWRKDARLLSVYPAFTTLTKFTLPLGARNQSEGMARYSKIGESMELMGVRDYRDGDDIRRIDWPGTARLGSFVVKEFEEDELKRIALITDTHVPPPRLWKKLRRAPKESEELEAALELTAALAEYFSRGEAAVELFAVGPEVHHLETGRGTTSFDAVCDILSGIEPSQEPALAQLEPDVFRDLSEVGGAVVILIGDDDDRRKFVERLRESGISLRVFLISDEPSDLPPDWFALSPKAIRTGMVREL